MKYKRLPHFTKEIDGRTVTGIFAVHGNIDSGNDVSLPGSFAKRLADDSRKRVRFLWNHDSYQPPIASIKSIREIGRDELPEKVLEFAPDATGGVEVVREYYQGVPLADWVFTAVSKGDIEEMSYAYDVHDWDMEERDGKRVRILKDVELFDISDVTWGMNPATAGVKRAPWAKKGEALASLIGELVAGMTGDDMEEEDIWEEMADATDRDVATIRGILSGDIIRPSDEILEGLAGYFEIEVDRLTSAADEDAEKRWLPTGLRFTEHADAARTVAKAFSDRARDIHQLRAKEGRVLSEANRNRIKALCDALLQVHNDLDNLLAATEPKADPARVLAEYAEFQRLTAVLDQNL